MNATNARFSIWPILAAVLSGLLLPVVIGGAAVVVRRDLGFASSDLDSAAGPLDRMGKAQDQIRLGVAYLPPPKTPDMRIYIEEGFETDLAHEIEERLHTDVKVVLVPPAERLAALNENRVDAILARLSDDDPLHQTVQILPTGYESGLSPIMRSDKPLRSWSDLADHVVCVTAANDRGRRLAQSLGAEVKTLRAPAEALILVRTGQCAAAIHDRAMLDPLFTKRSWQKFSATLPAVDPTSLVVAVAKHRIDLATRIKQVLTSVGSSVQWRQRQERWAELASFDVYRDQAGADCH